MDCNQIYVNILFEHKKNKLDFDLMPSLSFIQKKYEKISNKNKNYEYFIHLWNEHITRIQRKIFDNHYIFVEFNVIKKYCNELPFEYQNYDIIYALCKSSELYKKTITNMHNM